MVLKSWDVKQVSELLGCMTSGMGTGEKSCGKVMSDDTANLGRTRKK